MLRAVVMQYSIGLIDIVFIEAYNSMEEEDNHQLFPINPQWFDPDSHYPTPEEPPFVPASQNPLNSELAALSQAKTRFLNFAQQIGRLHNTPIRKDIFDYAVPGFKNQKIREDSFDYGQILRNIELRIQKMRKTRKIKKNWGEDDLKILVWTVSKYCEQRLISDPQKQLDQPDWSFVASLIPGVTAESCHFKWLGLKKVTLAHHSWTTAQSQLLRELVGRRTTPRHCSEIKDWKTISQELYYLYSDPGKCYRNAKQCRQHWTCYLSPKLKKGPWTRNEDLKLFRFIYSNRGHKRWSEIAKEFNGRTENALKNRYTLLIDKQKKQHRKSVSEMELIQQFIEQTQMAEIMGPDYEQDEMSYIKEVERVGKEKNKDETQSKSDASQDREEPTIPIQVKKIILKDFENLSYDFWKALQPGIMETNGQFKKFSRKDTNSQTPELNLPLDSNIPQSSDLLPVSASLLPQGNFGLNSFYSEQFVRDYDQFDNIINHH